MNIQGIIFDSDGTLVDSERLAATVLQRLLRECDIDLPHSEVLARFRGVQFAVFTARLAARYPWLDPEPFMHEFRVKSLELFAQGMQPMPGVEAFLARSPLPRCVASNGPRNKIETCLSAAGLIGYFQERIVSAYEVGAWKPDPGLILAAAQTLGLPVEDCLLVDDSHAGVEAGLAAGAWVAGYGDEDFSPYLDLPRFRLAPGYDDLEALLTTRNQG
ncbi:HAD family hydrolase [Pseudomonas sp. DC3200b2]|uniref:HAD family hydrolase n=1 Tax=Pseudomonas sp. DC3200b2 TaxID=2804669 RepID=UPI003CF0B0A1